MISVFVAALAALLSAVLTKGRFCLGTCSVEWIPWADIGMVYYLIAAGLFVFKKQSKYLRYYVLAGVAVHVFLVFKMFFSGFCPACFSVAIGSVYLALAAFNVIGEKEPKSKNWYYAVLAIVLVTGIVYMTGKPVALENAAGKAATASAVVEEDGRYSQVFRPDGTTVNLDLKKKPAVVFAWWCHPCDQVLNDIASMEERPYVVGLVMEGRGAKETLETLEKARLNGIPENEVYFSNDSNIKKVPVKIRYDGEKQIVEGIK